MFNEENDAASPQSSSLIDHVTSQIQLVITEILLDQLKFRMVETKDFPVSSIIWEAFLIPLTKAIRDIVSFIVLMIHTNVTKLNKYKSLVEKLKLYRKAQS